MDWGGEWWSVIHPDQETLQHGCATFACFDSTLHYFVIEEARVGVFHGYQTTLSNEKAQV